MNYNYLTWNNNDVKIQKSMRKEVMDNINEKISNLREKNNREECIIKQANRDYIIQTNINPFLKCNNYINDINNQEKYLRQKNLKLE